MRSGIILSPPICDIKIQLYGIFAEIGRIKDNKCVLLSFRKNIGKFRSKEGSFNLNVKGEVFMPINRNKNKSVFGFI